MTNTKQNNHHLRREHSVSKMQVILYFLSWLMGTQIFTILYILYIHVCEFFKYEILHFKKRRVENVKDSKNEDYCLCITIKLV